VLEGSQNSWREGGNGSFHAGFVPWPRYSKWNFEYTGTLERITPAASDSNTCLTFIKIVIAVIWTLFSFRWYHLGYKRQWFSEINRLGKMLREKDTWGGGLHACVFCSNFFLRGELIG